MGGRLEWRSVFKRRSWSGQRWKDVSEPLDLRNGEPGEEQGVKGLAGPGSSNDGEGHVGLFCVPGVSVSQEDRTGEFIKGRAREKGVEELSGAEIRGKRCALEVEIALEKGWIIFVEDKGGIRWALSGSRRLERAAWRSAVHGSVVHGNDRDSEDASSENEDGCGWEERKGTVQTSLTEDELGGKVHVVHI
jgi:hypothetical protein